jgi:hypothetical protein
MNDVDAGQRRRRSTARLVRQVRMELGQNRGLPRRAAMLTHQCPDTGSPKPPTPTPHQAGRVTCRARRPGQMITSAVAVEHITAVAHAAMETT